MKFHVWWASRFLSLNDACSAIENSDLGSRHAVAKRLGEFLEAYDYLDDNLAAFERALDAVDAAIREGIAIDLLIQIRDDLTYFPDEIVSQLRGAQ